jgi:inorganic triphosphatase YgiF
VAIERELKFSTADDHVPSTLELDHALVGTGLSVLPGAVKRHVDVYHDVDGRLAASGMALRLRRSTTGVLVTLKSDARLTSRGDGVIHERSEVEVSVADAPGAAMPVPGVPAAQPAATPATQAASSRPDGPGVSITWPEQVRSSLPADVDIELLAPVAELRVRRVAFLVVNEPDPSAAGSRLGERPAARTTPTARPFAELAFDEVTCVAPGSTDDTTAFAVFHEVEIEWLGEGDDIGAAELGALERLAEAVGTVVNLTASTVSKLDRALALLAALHPE